MKPFDLAAALRGEHVVTVNGTNVHFVGVEVTGMPVIQFMGGPLVGQFHKAAMRDLFMAPKKRTVWVNLKPGDQHEGAARWHATPADADTVAPHDRIGGKAWPLEIEE